MNRREMKRVAMGPLDVYNGVACREEFGFWLDDTVWSRVASPIQAGVLDETTAVIWREAVPPHEEENL